MAKVWVCTKGASASLFVLEEDHRLSLAWCRLEPLRITLNGVACLVGPDGITKRIWERLVKEAFGGQDDVGTAENPLKVAVNPAWGDTKLSIELRRKGAAKKSFNMIMYPPYTIEAIKAFLERKDDALEDADINLWLLHNAVPLDTDMFIREAEQHAYKGILLPLEWESASKAILALTPNAGLRLLDLPVEYTIWLEDTPLASMDYTIPLPESVREAFPMWAESGFATIDGVVNHFAQDLFLRQRQSPDPVMTYKGATARELISPVLQCVASLVPHTVVRADKVVKGRRSHGTVDNVLDHRGISVICIEAKLHDGMWDHLGQLCGAIRAERDALRSKVLGKRKYGMISSTEEQDALGKLRKMPTFALLTSASAIHYMIFKYTEDPLELVQFQRLCMPANIGSSRCNFSELKQCMFCIVRHLIGLLESQVKDAAEYLPANCLKKKAKH